MQMCDEQLGRAHLGRSELTRRRRGDRRICHCHTYRVRRSCTADSSGRTLQPTELGGAYNYVLIIAFILVTRFIFHLLSGHSSPE